MRVRQQRYVSHRSLQRHVSKGAMIIRTGAAYAIAAVLAALLIALIGQHWLLLSARTSLAEERKSRSEQVATLERTRAEAAERHQAELLSERAAIQEIEDDGRTKAQGLAAELAAARGAGDAKLRAAQRMLDASRAAAARDRGASAASTACGCPGAEPASDMPAILLGWAQDDARAADDIATFADSAASARDSCQRAYEVTQ